MNFFSLFNFVTTLQLTPCFCALDILSEISHFDRGFVTCFFEGSLNEDNDIPSEFPVIIRKEHCYEPLIYCEQCITLLLAINLHIHFAPNQQWWKKKTFIHSICPFFYLQIFHGSILYCFPSVTIMYCYTKIYRSPPAQTYLWECNTKKKKNKKIKQIKQPHTWGDTCFSHQYMLQKEMALTLETNSQFYSEIPCERTNHNFEESSRHLIFQQGFRFSFFFFVFPPFFCLPFLPHIASSEFLFSTNLRNHLHFITSIFYHPWQASPRSLPLCISLPNIPFALLHALALIANPHQICHSYSDTQIHIMKCNFFRFMEQEDFGKEDDKLDQNICVFLLPPVQFSDPQGHQSQWKSHVTVV